MDRFTELTEKLSNEIALTIAAGGAPDFASIEAALLTQEAADIAEHNAIKVCGCCRRVFNEAQFSQLPPAAGGLFLEDEWQLDEYRNCTCGSTLVVTRKVYKPYEDRKVVPVYSVAQHVMPCDDCWNGIHIGEQYLHRLRPPGPRWPGTKTNLCLHCAKRF